MGEKILPPIIPSNKYAEDLEKELSKMIKEKIYIPLMNLIKKEKSLKNSREDLVQYIKEGGIVYHHGKFTGKFNSTISKELRKLGAKWDRKTSSYKIPLAKLPIEIKNVIKIAENKFVKKMALLDKNLTKVMPGKIVKKSVISQIFDKSIFRIDSQIGSSLEGITVTPKFSASARKKILEEYSNNMDLYIQKWTEGEVKNLRKRIKKHTLTGARYEDIVETIQKSYGVGKSKAKFLARQETNLLVSKMKEIRYNEVGLDEYIWYTVIGSPNHPVRPMHKRLDRTRHKFSDPPVVNDKGDKKNPGEDYNCRCTARVVVRF